MQHSPDATQNTAGPSRKRGQKPSPGKRTPKKLQHLPPLSLSNIFTRLKPEFPVQRRRRSTKAGPAARRSSPHTTVADSCSSPLEHEESPSASFQATIYENTQAIEQAIQEPYFPHLLPGHDISHAFVDPLEVGDQDPSHSQPDFCFAPPPVAQYDPPIGVPMVPFPFPDSDNENPGFNFDLAQIPGIDQHSHPGDLAGLARPSYPYYYPMGMARPEPYYLYPDSQFSTDGGQFHRSTGT